MSVRILPYRSGPDLSSLIADFLPLGERARFVVPSRRDRDWWLTRSGRGEYGPLDDAPGTVWIWQDLYDDIGAACGASRRRPISPPDHLLILGRILKDALDEAPELVKRWPGLGRSGFLDILSNDIRELLNEAVRPEQMDMMEIDGGIEGPMPHLLPKVYRRYLAYLRENKLLDSAQIWTAAAELLGAGAVESWGKDLTLIFTGFLSFTHGQLELVRALETACEEVVVLKPEAGLSGFYDAAEQLSAYTWEAAPEGVQGRMLEIPVVEPSLEPEAIARGLALWAAGKGDLAREMEFPGFGAIGIMTPRGGEEPLTEAMERCGIPFTLDVGAPIAQTLPGRVLAAVRRLHSLGFPTHETILLLTQPCFAGSEFPAANALRAGPVGLAAWERYLKSAKKEGKKETGRSGRAQIIDTALSSIQAVKELCRVIAAGGEPSALMTGFHQFLTAGGLWLDRMRTLDWPELDESLRLCASAIETVGEKALTLRELLPDIGPIGRQEMKGDEAFDYLETWCQQSHTRPPLPLSGAVHIYSGPPPVLSSYPVWVMLDVTQSNWPGRIESSPLLGATERKRLGENGAHLPSAQEKGAQKEALFRRLIQTGENLTVITRAEIDEKDRPSAESPFVGRFLDDMGQWWRRRTLSTLPLEVLTGGGLPFPEIDPMPGEAVECTTPVLCDPDAGGIILGVSLLNEFLSCPLRWWLLRRGKLQERNLELVTSADWGHAAHALWEGVWRRLREDLDKADGAALSRLVQEEWDVLAAGKGAYANLENLGRLLKDRRLQRQLETLRFRILRLGGLQARVLDRMRKAELRHKEVRMEEDARLQIELDGVTFKGQCDRIEIVEEPSGRLHALITDYKSGKSESYEGATKNLTSYPWNEEKREKFEFGLQLSAYALMFQRTRQNVPLSGVCILGLKDGTLAGTFEKAMAPFFEPEAVLRAKLTQPLEERQDEAEYAMGCAAALLRRGRFMPVYDGDSCHFCTMAAICRKGEKRGESLLSEDGEEI